MTDAAKERDRIVTEIIATAAEQLGYDTEGGAIRHGRRSSVGIVTAKRAVAMALDSIAYGQVEQVRDAQRRADA